MAVAGIGTALAGLRVVVVAAFVWAGLDGIRDHRAHPEPDEGDDLTMRWLAAGAVTGLVGGVLTWLVDTVTPIPVGVTSLFFEISSGAAFTVLLVFLPAMAAVTLGRFFARRNERKAARDDDWSVHREHHAPQRRSGRVGGFGVREFRAAGRSRLAQRRLAHRGVPEDRSETVRPE